MTKPSVPPDFVVVSYAGEHRIFRWSTGDLIPLGQTVTERMLQHIKNVGGSWTLHSAQLMVGLVHEDEE